MSYISTPTGYRLGEVKDEGDRIYAYNRIGFPLGFYDKKTDYTYDSNGNPIVRGDITSSLVYTNGDK